MDISRREANRCSLYEYRVKNEEMTEEIDHEHTSNIVCPHCGFEDEDSWECYRDSDDTLCNSCGEKFHYERRVETTYSTTKASH